MRRILETFALVALALLVWITWRALYGPAALPARIPTHFGADGQPNAWGPPASLWLLPAVSAGVYLLITVASLFPSAFNYPVRTTPLTRPRMEALTLQMISWIKLELAGLFLYLQWTILETVRAGRPALPPAFMPLFLIAVFGTVGAFAVAIVRTARGSAAR